jgi:Zn-dependent metalloprotease
MESNRAVQFNWGTFNVPTLVTVLTVFWYTATHSERQDSRLDALEVNNTVSQTSISKTLEAIQIKTNPLDNLTYRITVVEQNLTAINQAVNARIDRQGDSVQGLRDDINKLSISFSVLSQKIDSVLPEKRSELTSVPGARASN